MEGRVGMQAGTVATSVVIPAYNTQDYLPACLDSVLAQTQRNIEVIVVDDGSTDASGDIARAYAARDGRVRAIFQKNARQGAARNAGLAAASGTYVYFLDSDDLATPSLLQECFDACEEGDLDFCTFDSRGFSGNPDVASPHRFEEFRDRAGRVDENVHDGVDFWERYFTDYRLPFVCWLHYFRRSFLLEHGLRFREGIYFEDNDWVLRAYLAARRMRYLPRKLHRYRERAGSTAHGGMNEALVGSCLAVHGILLDLLRSQGDAQRKAMVWDMGYLSNLRFAAFGEFAPGPKVRRDVAEFMRGLFASCEGEAADGQEREWNGRALCALREGTSNWAGFALPAAAGACFSILFGARPPARQARVGVYGTGKACRYFLDMVGDYFVNLVFFETQPPSGARFGGSGILPIAAAADCGLDVLLVASTKHGAEMAEQAERVLGDAVPVMRMAPDALSMKGGGRMAAARRLPDVGAYMNTRGICLLSDSAWGAIVRRKLGLRLASPFEGMAFRNGDYLRLLENLHQYLGEQPRLAQARYDSAGKRYRRVFVGDVEARLPEELDFEDVLRAWEERRGNVADGAVLVQMTTADPSAERLFARAGAYPHRLCLVPYEPREACSVQIPLQQGYMPLQDLLNLEAAACNSASPLHPAQLLAHALGIEKGI